MYKFRYQYKHSQQSIPCETLDLARYTRNLVMQWFNVKGEVLESKTNMPVSEELLARGLETTRVEVSDFVSSDAPVAPRRDKRRFYLTKQGRHELLGAINEAQEARRKAKLRHH